MAQGVIEYEVDSCLIRISVCSPDNEQYEISLTEPLLQSEVVTRDGNSLAPVMFTTYPLSNCSCSCDITVTGTIIGENTVELMIVGENCDCGASEDYEPASFEATVEVTLNLTGDCEIGALQ